MNGVSTQGEPGAWLLILVKHCSPLSSSLLKASRVLEDEYLPIPAPCLLTLNQDLSFIHVDSSDCVAVFEPYSLFLGEGCFSSVAVLMLDGDL